MRKALTIIALSAAALFPLAPAAMADTPAPHAVCITDGECALWDAAGYTAVTYDAAGQAVCAAGTEVFDTENPDLGDTGIVCRPLIGA